MHNSNDQSQNSYAGTPDSGTRSTTPRQIGFQQFVPFQSKLKQIIFLKTFFVFF